MEDRGPIGVFVDVIFFYFGFFFFFNVRIESKIISLKFPVLFNHLAITALAFNVSQPCFHKFDNIVVFLKALRSLLKL